MPLQYDAKGNPVFTRGGAPQPQPQAAQGGGAVPNWAYRNQAGRASKDPNAELQRLLDQLEQYKAQLQQQMQGPQSQLQVNPEDVQLMQQMQAASLGPALAQISAQQGARGLAGSSFEQGLRGQAAVQSALGGQQFLQNQAFGRAQFEVGKNRALFDSLTGAAGNQFAMTQSTKPVKKQGGGVMGAIGGLLGGAAGSFLGPLGTAAGGALGKSLFGGGGGNYQYQDNSQPWYGMHN